VSASAPDLRQRAEALGASLPALLAEAERLASVVMLGAHGRRRAGLGDEFWQYRPAQPTDPVRLIDWRRSARSDQVFLREREWQAAQSVVFWVDDARSMGFSGGDQRPSKRDRAGLLALALAALLLRGGERVGLLGAAPPRAGRGHLARLAAALSGEETRDDYGQPGRPALPAHGRAVLLSDFLGPVDSIERLVTEAAGQGIRGVLLQVLDPAEESFPFDGRTIFESMSGAIRHETLRAGDLRGRYLERLAERRARLETLARRTGWFWHAHSTGAPAMTPLLWAYAALEGGR
jgi:uncharacterized protein (DUF58 family)